MKTDLESFGFSTFITVFLPGLTLAMGIGYICYANPNAFLELRAPVQQLFDAIKTFEWQQIFLILAVVSLLGCTIAAINGVLEWLVYDKLMSKYLGIPAAQYSAQWHEYVYRLSKENNDYINRLAMAFLFESRMAIALGILAIAEWYVGDNVVAAWLIGAALLFSFFAAAHHLSLAEYRQVMYPRWVQLTNATMALTGQNPAAPGTLQLTLNH